MAGKAEKNKQEGPLQHPTPRSDRRQADPCATLPRYVIAAIVFAVGVLSGTSSLLSREPAAAVNVPEALPTVSVPEMTTVNGTDASAASSLSSIVHIFPTPGAALSWART